MPSSEQFREFHNYYWRSKSRVDDRIEEVLDDHEEFMSKRRLLAHAVVGGKRIRPVLTLLTADVYGTPYDKALNHASVVELIHNACVTGDTRIRMADGTVREITGVDVGDEVLAFDDEEGKFVPREVTHFHENGVQDVVLVQMGNREVKCTPDHEFLVYEKEQPVRWRPTEVVKERADDVPAIVGRADADAPDGTVQNWVYGAGKDWDAVNYLSRSDARSVLDAIGIDAPLEEVCEPKQMEFETPDVSFKYVEASELSEGDVIVAAKETKHRTRTTCGIEPPGDLSIEEYARLAGIIVGDGTVGEYRMAVSIPEDDPCRDWVVEKLSSASGNAIREYPTEVETADVSLCRALREHGLAEVHTEIRIPEWVWAASAEVQRQFAVGLVDSDGTVKKNGMVTIGLANHSLVRDYKELLDQLGFTTSNIWSREVSTAHIEGRPTTTTRLYHLSVGPHRVVDELVPLSPEYRRRLEGFGRARSMRLANEVVFPDGGEPDFDEVGFTRVRSVAPLDEPQETFDLRVEGDHNYIADGVVTHNSLVADDKVDGDDERRGNPAVWRLIDKLPLGKKGDQATTALTVMSQNGLLALALELVEDPDVLNAMGDSVRRLTDGFFLEGREVFYGLLGGGYDRYIEINKTKTGGLFALSSWMPATYVDVSEEEVEAARKYGETVGILYQIADDWADGDLPSFIKDPNAELEDWYDKSVGYVEQMPAGENVELMGVAPAYMVYKMMEQEDMLDEIDVHFIPDLSETDLSSVPDDVGA
jgi:geranylgeranyl pyrophosphate synthase/intein/homing endonuclease